MEVMGVMTVRVEGGYGAQPPSVAASAARKPHRSSYAMRKRAAPPPI